MEIDFNINDLKISETGLLIEFKNKRQTVSIKNFKEAFINLYPNYFQGEFVNLLRAALGRDEIEFHTQYSFWNQEADSIIYFTSPKGIALYNDLLEFEAHSDENEYKNILYFYLANFNELENYFDRMELSAEIIDSVYFIFIDDIISKLLKHGLIETEAQRLERLQIQKSKRILERQKFKINSFLQGAKETLSPAEVSQKSLKQVCRSKKISCGQEMTKSQLIGLISEYKSLRTSHHEQKKEQQKEDIFGNQIIDPVLGDDGVIYDKKSMQEWFKKDAKGQYINIKYIYNVQNQRVPNFVSLGGKKPLTSYQQIKK